LGLKPKGKHFVLENRLFLFLKNEKQRSCDGRGGAQRPFWRVNEPKKTGARSARARTRGQNPLVINNKCLHAGYCEHVQYSQFYCLYFKNVTVNKDDENCQCICFVSANSIFTHLKKIVLIFDKFGYASYDNKNHATS
jgi:hypothetical protein